MVALSMMSVAGSTIQCLVSSGVIMVGMDGCGRWGLVVSSRSRE